VGDGASWVEVPEEQVKPGHSVASCGARLSPGGRDLRWGEGGCAPTALVWFCLFFGGGLRQNRAVIKTKGWRETLSTGPLSQLAMQNHRIVKVGEDL